MRDLNEPSILSGGISVDDRGMVSFHNSLDLTEWRRFYFVSNHEVGFVRAWHGHKIERKIAVPVSGTFLLACVRIKNWEAPDTAEQPQLYTLSSNSPRALYIPAGFANGFKSLTQHSTIMFLSSSTLEQSHSDDFRYPWNYWNPWESNYR
jgi:dTDP-4-dehydrorhamnose 3,5-epimerase-like enzyme